MIHECSYCTFQSSYKSNLKSHMKSKHNDKIPIEKDEGKSMKNHKNKIKNIPQEISKERTKKISHARIQPSRSR